MPVLCVTCQGQWCQPRGHEVHASQQNKITADHRNFRQSPLLKLTVTPRERLIGPYLETKALPYAITLRASTVVLFPPPQPSAPLVGLRVPLWTGMRKGERDVCVVCMGIQVLLLESFSAWIWS